MCTHRQPRQANLRGPRLPRGCSLQAPQPGSQDNGVALQAGLTLGKEPDSAGSDRLRGH